MPRKDREFEQISSSEAGKQFRNVGFQLAYSDFDRDLPEGHGRDKYRVGIVENRARRRWKFALIVEQPVEDVRIEQNPQSSSPRPSKYF